MSGDRRCITVNLLLEPKHCFACYMPTKVEKCCIHELLRVKNDGCHSSAFGDTTKGCAGKLISGALCGYRNTLMLENVLVFKFKIILSGCA